jgi:hypothetical protein
MANQYNSSSVPKGDFRLFLGCGRSFLFSSSEQEERTADQQNRK